MSFSIKAAVYGLICVGVAFVAQYLGGVLQVSLTIFGVIGGPLLAIFTLGMCTKLANQYGIISGLVTGIAFSMWVGFGGKCNFFLHIWIKKLFFLF